MDSDDTATQGRAAVKMQEETPFANVIPELTHWPFRDIAVIFKLIIKNRILETLCEIALKWIPEHH